MKKILIWCLLLISSISMANSSKILIEYGTNQAISIVIIGDDPAWNKIANIVMNDLYNSGLFNPRVSSSLNSNAQYKLQATVKSEGLRIKINFLLIAVKDNKLIFSGNLSGKAEQERDLAHYISNQIFKKITGLNGDFASKILYISKKDNSFTLNLADYDGARSQVLFRSKSPILSPRFSPDGKSIAYVSFESGKPQIFLQELKNGSRKVLTNFAGLNSAPAFAPDGQKLAFVLSKDGNPEIYVMNLANKKIKRITNHFAIDTEPVWAKDSQTLYFTSDRSGKPQIYKQNINHTNAERVTFAGNYNANPKISNDDISLVTVHRSDGYTNFQIGVHNLVRKSLQIISQNGLNDAPTISPNGSMVIYVVKIKGKESLMLSSINGRVNKPLINLEGDVREPNWSFK